MSGITYVDHDSGATFVHGHVHLRQSDRCLTGSCVNVPLRDRIAAALNSGTVIDAIERIIESELGLRTDALNRTGASNDQLRAELAEKNARLANVEKVPDYIAAAPAETWGVDLYVPDDAQAAYMAGANAAITFAMGAVTDALGGER